MTTTATVEAHQTITTDNPADAAHIVMTPANEPDETPQAYVMRARIEGFPVTALCGHTWVPQKDPAPLPVCATCLSYYQVDPFQNDHESRDELPDA